MRITPPRGLGGAGAPQCVDPLSFLVRAAAAVGGGGQKKSCFDLAENRAADSLWIGAHRYTRIKFASKLIWVSSDLKLGQQFGRLSNP